MGMKDIKTAEITESELRSITPGQDGKADTVLPEVFRADETETADRAARRRAAPAAADYAVSPPGQAPQAPPAAAGEGGVVALPTALLTLTGSVADSSAPTPTSGGAAPLVKPRRSRRPAGHSAEKPPFVPDSRDPQTAEPLKYRPKNPESYKLFTFLDLREPRTAEELVASGYHLGVIPWPDPAHLGWNPLASDFGAGASGETYTERANRHAYPAITTEMAWDWAERQKRAAHLNYVNSMNLQYIIREEWRGVKKKDNVPKCTKLRTVTGLDGSRREGSGELFYELLQSHVSFCASTILGELRPDVAGGQGKKIGFYIGGTPGGGKTVMAKQLAAHLGVPCVSLSLTPDERLTERIFYTETMSAGGSRAELTDVAYVYCVGGILQIDDAHHQDDLGYLSTLLDPNVGSITLRAADAELDGAELVRHPAFRAIVTYNGPEHQKSVGLGTEIPSNVRDRMHQISNDWDGYVQIADKKSGHWTTSHQDKRVALYGKMAHKLMDEVRNRVGSLESLPSVRHFDALLSGTSLYNSVAPMSLLDPSGRDEWVTSMESFVSEMLVSATDHLDAETMAAGYDPLEYNSSAKVDELYSELREHIIDVYGTLPGVTAFGTDLADKTPEPVGGEPASENGNG